MENYWSETQDARPSTAESSAAGLSDPSVIGRYRIVRRLGQGGFGRVYLAHDDDLDRPVAIKVPNPERIAGLGDVEVYLAEARALAKLNHANIVPVYDLGRTQDGLCYVVSKYIDGCDLADQLARGRPSLRESAELTAVIAGALHHAHTRGLVHRDVKPSNILIDASKEAWLADFGLALRDEDYGKGAKLAGTPSYMSPEQARGEGHRVDGRSDIFSLGVVLYELLTGRKPFRGDSRIEVLEQIATVEPRPLRQIDDTIPRELERICQKALAKRASERYGTGRDMADDLRHFLHTEAPSVSAPPPPSTLSTPPPVRETTPSPITPLRSDSEGRAVKIVPKGLRSFDRNDADFFLELLPGPRDREGLPESLRFWKTRIESTDPDATFRVGLIYGPSGCGKSSLVKAGLLPRLSKHVLPAYIEATPEDTEARLQRALRKICPELPTGLGLVDSLAALRRGHVLLSGQKALLVIDQFEQWLFARGDEQSSELVAALRQCDGEHLQAVVMVRDDFWMAATRFMRDLEIRLVEGENSAAVDLFDLLHARRVLIAYGRAFGVLPEKASELSSDQRSFVEQAVAGLAQDGKVIPVRLALFAEMVKGRPWTPATLRDIGGAEGVGVTFLEETFSASTAPPEHRLHQKAAQAVLKALLPQSGTDIKGQMRPESELRSASGYEARPRDFADVISILDAELRLITPTEEKMSDHSPLTTHHSPTRYYQLTHDYLVHSLRDWLTRKQRESRRGRAELKLAERAAIWSGKPEMRHLPTALEWASIRALTRSREWSDPERRMMRRAGYIHGLRSIALAAIGVGVGAVGLMAWNREVKARKAEADTARSQVQQLLRADIVEIPRFIQEIEGHRRWADPELRRVVGDQTSSQKARLNARLALLPVDEKQVPYLETCLRNATPAELVVMRERLQSYRARLTPSLWQELDEAKEGDSGILPIAGALAYFAPESPHWNTLGEKVALALAKADRAVLGDWLEVIGPVHRKLAGPAAAVFRDPKATEAIRSQAIDILVDYGRDQPELLGELLMVADDKAYQAILDAIRGQEEKVAPLFQAALQRDAGSHWTDPSVDPSWTKPDAYTDRIHAALGFLDERFPFAFCQRLSLDQFEETAKGLGSSGYRPIRLRPYSDGPAVNVAAVWTRDGRKWDFAVGLSADEIHRKNEKLRAEKLVPVDVAGYVTIGSHSEPVDRYTALWVEASDGEDVRLYVGESFDTERDLHERFKELDLSARTIDAFQGALGLILYSGVWGRRAEEAPTGQADRGFFESDFRGILRQRSDTQVLDVSVNGAAPSRSASELAGESRDRAEQQLQARPGDLDSRAARAIALLRLGAAEKALIDLDYLIGAGDVVVAFLPYRAVAHAKLGRKTEALRDLATIRAEYLPEHTKLFVAAVVAAELGEGAVAPKAIEALDAAVAKQPDNAELRYEAVRAFALASKAIARRDQVRGSQFKHRALELLKKLVVDKQANFRLMDEDPALDPLRDDPAFPEIMKAGQPDRRYAAVWSNEARYESVVKAGIDPEEQLLQSRELVKDGYRPVAWSVAKTTPNGPLASVSVWSRPRVSDAEKDALAARQARAAVALIRMEKAEAVWPLLQHSPDPRLRSFIINWLGPLGADPAVIAAELDRANGGGAAVGIVGRGSHGPAQGTGTVGRGSPDPALPADRRSPLAPIVGRGSPDPALPADRRSPLAPGATGEAGRPSVRPLARTRDLATTKRSGALATTNPMDSVLFDRETSTRRALIQALGSYKPADFSPADRERLTAKLLELYQNDPDAGIHSAAEWALRRWQEQQKLAVADSQLGKTDAANRGNRRWFTSRAGQTFAVIEGPVEFTMGAPSTDIDRNASSEPQRAIRIPRRFAISTKEASIGELQKFVQTESQFQVDRSYRRLYSPASDGPWIGATWYAAVAYCNWLSKQEGLPREQWCYQPNDGGFYAEGMRIPSDVVERKGYRLPTEAEWEYACRAGTVTSRYYGSSAELLGKYAWFQANSGGHAWVGGSLLPNDLGLFDMLGNAYEWCQDRNRLYRPIRAGSFIDNAKIEEIIVGKHARLFRGGAFASDPAEARSAYRIGDLPTYESYLSGFRLARTCD